MGKKEYNSNLKIPIQNKFQNIYEYDILFNNVLDYLDDIDKESSFSDDINNLIIPRESLSEDMIKVVNTNFMEEKGILAEGKDFWNNTENYSEKKNKKKKGHHNRNISSANQNNEHDCSKNVCKCNCICLIF